MEYYIQGILYKKIKRSGSCTYVAAASSLARNRRVPGNWCRHQGSGKQFQLSHNTRVLTELTPAHKFRQTVLIGSHQEDMAASSCQQNNTSKWAGSTCFTKR